MKTVPPRKISSRDSSTKLSPREDVVQDLLRKKRESERELTRLDDVSCLLTTSEEFLSQELLREATTGV